MRQHVPPTRPPLALLALAALVPAACSESGPAAPDLALPLDGTPSLTDGQRTEGRVDGSAGAATIRIAQYNIFEFSTEKIVDPQHPQTKAAAEILARIGADIVCVNEIQHDIKDVPKPGLPGVNAATTPIVLGTANSGESNARRLADQIKAVNGELDYKETLITLGNSGFKWEGDTLGQQWFYLRGWGEFPGRFNTAVLSRYPILKDQVRVIHDVAWKTLPENTLAQLKAAKGLEVPDGYPVYEKALSIVPIQVPAPGGGSEILYLVLLHPCSPVYYPTDLYRNHDEVLTLKLFLDGKLPGVQPLPAGAKFVVVGDLNADPDDGDSLPGTAAQIVDHPAVRKFYPRGAGTKGHSGAFNTYVGGCGRNDGNPVTDPTTKFQLQLDYLLASQTVERVVDGAVFFPDYLTAKADFDLACRGSDHMAIHIDLQLSP